MTNLQGTRVYWRPSTTTSSAVPPQILKNSGYISVVLQAVQYKAGGTFWQRLFGGKDKVTVSTQVVWESGSDSKTAAAIQDFRKVSVPSVNSLAIGRNVVLKVPAAADGIELKVSIGAIQDDNLGRTLQLLNSDEFKQPLQLAPVAVGQALTIASLVKKAFTDTDPADVLAASYPGIISESATLDPVNNNRLVEGYIILIVKQDKEDQLDFDPTEISVSGNGLLVAGRPIANTYMVYNVSFDKWRGRDVASSWSKKFDQASTKVDELMFATAEQRAAIINSAFDLLKAASALLDDDVTYITAEKTNLKKAAILEVQGKIDSNAAPPARASTASRSLSQSVAELSAELSLASLEFAGADVRADVARYSSELAACSLPLGFSVKLDAVSLDALSASRAFAPVARQFTPDQLAALRPYVVSMRKGRWDTTGIFNSTPGDVQALFFEHAEKALQALPPNKKLKFVVYAHGGLVAEDHGLTQAQAHINWWQHSATEGIYPLYFVWKTGLGETIASLLGLAASRAGPSRAFITDPIVAALARALGGEAIWSDMKADAELALQANGAATFVAQQMKAFCDSHKGRVEIHAVGHSAGAVFHAHYIPASIAAGNIPFTTTSFLAPAVRVDTFIDTLTCTGSNGRELLPGLGKLAILTMKKDFERRDNCAEIYHQSLLYLIYHALESTDKAPILGLEESIRTNPQLLQMLGLGGVSVPNAAVIWSPTAQSEGPSASRAIHHGDFSNDSAALDSILCRILGVAYLSPDQKYPQSRSLKAPWNIWSTAGPKAVAPSGIAVAGAPEPASASAGPDSVRAPQRIALCVGIDNYINPANRLSGCVNDANAWSGALAALGFQIRSRFNEQATHAQLITDLKDLVASGRPGDVLVFQYAGHGTQVPEEGTRRTIDGMNVAMVPVNFSADTPNLLMDFEIKSIFDVLPAGVNLSCFIDCCHSNTDTRAFVASGAAVKARRIILSIEEAAAVRRTLASAVPASRGITIDGQEQMRNISFAACLDNELAYESAGHGDFTRHATGILRNGIDGISNEAFAAAVASAFGSSAQQHPQLDCATPMKSKSLLQV